MATLTIITPEEIAARKKSPRQQQREERERMITSYVHQLSKTRAGYGGEIILTEGEDKLKIRALLKEAATRSKIQVRLLPRRDPSRIVFLVESPAPAKRGRPKQTSA